jgi:precorrin-6Y C5,15-methyltransferase (decarboxylating)
MPSASPLPRADLYVGGRRHLDGLSPTVVLGDVAAALDAIEAEPGDVCVLASGDPGFFGIGRALAERFGPGALDVRPAPSSIALAFARLGLPWDDAVVVSAHGRPLAHAVRAVTAAGAAKCAVLVSPDSPPEALGKELLATGRGARAVAVCSRLGMEGESVTRTDLDGLASGTWDPLSVVVLLADDAAVAPAATLRWGRPAQAFCHRDGMITKAEVRAIALGKLALPSSGVLWDVGAGSGSVAIEAATLAPGLRVIAIERDATHLRANVSEHGVAVELVAGDAPDAFAGLPDPDRAFVGGGGIAVLDAVLARLRPGGVIVATYAAVDRAAAAADRLGALVQVATSNGARLPDGGWRLAAENPVFVAWGPE